MDTGAEVTLIYGNPAKHKGEIVYINAYGDGEELTTRVRLRVALGDSLPFWARVYISHVPEYIIGIDLLQGREFYTPLGRYVFGVRAITVGRAKWTPLKIPPPAKPVNVKQYRLPGGHEEISRTIQGLLEVGILRPAASPFNAPVWPVKKPDGTWRMTVDYRQLNKHAPPLAVAVPDMVTLLEHIEKNAGVWHAVIDLANAFFSIPIDAESQDQFAFTWEGRQYTFQVLPQGYLHSPTLCHGLVARDLQQITLSLALFLAHYIDDVFISGPTEEDVQQGLITVIDHMRSRGWEINPKKIQGPAQQVQFLGVVWAGPVRHIPEKVLNVIATLQAPTSKTEAQRLVGLMGYWRQHIPHLAQILRPVYNVTRKKAQFEWGELQEKALSDAKAAVAAAMPLGPYLKGQPFELQVSANKEVAVWSLWQKSLQGKRVPLGFWSRKLPTVQYTPFEKQLLACYWALVETARLTGSDPVVLRPAIPIMAWVNDDSTSPRVGRAQQSSLIKWKWYIAERARPGSHGVSALQEQVLAVTPTGEEIQEIPSLELKDPPAQEAPPYEQVTHDEVWFTDGSARYQGNERVWRAAALNPRKQITLTRGGKGKSSQYAELMAVLMVMEHAIEQGGDVVYIYTDSWAVFKGLTVWFPKWKQDGFCIHNRPLWGQDLWIKLDQMLSKVQMHIGHVDGHTTGTPVALYNQAADRLARVRTATPEDEDEELLVLARWAHVKAGHLGAKATKEWAIKRGIPCSVSAAATVVANCQVCSQVRQMPLSKTPMGKLHRGSGPGQIWQIDYIGPLPKCGRWQYALTMVDTFSGYLLTYPCARANQQNTIKGLEMLIRRYGAPLQVQSDNGSHFAGGEVKDWANEWNIQWIYHIPHHPQASGLVERLNGLLKQKLKQLTPTHTLKGWGKVLDQAEFELNSRPLCAGQTPLQRMISLPAPAPVEYLKVWKLQPYGQPPLRATPDSAGADLITPKDVVVPAGGQVLVPLGIGVTVPHGTYGRIAPRSSLALKGLQVLGGVVDADYQGEVKVLLHNVSTQDASLLTGQRIAQLICERISVPDIQEAPGPPPSTVRRRGEFGSTDTTLTSGQKVWVVYPDQPNRPGEIVSKGPGATYWVLLANATAPICLDAAKLKRRE